MTRLAASDPRVQAAIGRKASRRRTVDPTGLLLTQCQLAGLPRPEQEVVFHRTRKWKADFLWLAPRRLIVELEGGVYVAGRHSRGAGLEEDCVKYAEALCLNFPVLRVTPRHVRQGLAVEWILRYFAIAPNGAKGV